MKLKIVHNNKCLMEESGEDMVNMVFPASYTKETSIELSVDQPGFYKVLLEDTMPETLVYVKDKAVFKIPFGLMNRICYNPRSFKGKQHYITARRADQQEIMARRNLALNPYDQHGETGMYPHASASTETRNEALFAARNAIDGVHANHVHYPWPYQSWGINKDPKATLTIDFAIPVKTDEIVLTLRADYPHDSHWTSADIVFDDEIKEKLSLEKTDQPQHFKITERTITSLRLEHLIKAEDDSPFPALTQIEVWGTIA